MFDKNIKFYTTRRKSKRWTLTLFINCLDTAFYNSFLTYIIKFPSFSDQSDRRRRFLIELSKSLIFLDTLTIERPIIVSGKLSKRKRCLICTDKDRKTSYNCVHCFTPICLEHTHFSCEKCIK